MAALPSCWWISKRSDEVPKESAEGCAGTHIERNDVPAREVFVSHPVEFTSIQETACESAQYGSPQHKRRFVPHGAGVDGEGTEALDALPLPQLWHYLSRLR